MINKFNKGDEVVINKRGDNRRGYDNLYGRTGKIQFVKIYEGHSTPEITYHVKVAGRKNPNQCDGWFVYDEEDLEFKCDTYSEPPIRAEHAWTCEFSTDCVPNIKIKEEKKEMELLNIYFDEKQKEIRNKYEEKDVKIRRKDPVYKELNDIAKKYEGVRGVVCYAGCDFEYSDEIRKALIKNDRDCDAQIDAIYASHREIMAQLDICETYEQKMNVLKAYGVVDEQGKLNK